MHIGEDDSGMARDNGRRENPDIPAKEEIRGGGSVCKSTMDWNQVGEVSPPSSLLHLLPPLVPPPIPLAQMLDRVLVQLHQRPWWHEMRSWPLQQLLELRL
jgi:hypothetical protein